MHLDSAYFKDYRKRIGQSNQSDAKDYLSAKDIKADIDYGYVDSLVQRLVEIYKKFNEVIHESVRHESFDAFSTHAIVTPCEQIKTQNIIVQLNNQGRRPEQVLFNWLRGYAATEFLKPAIAQIFGIDNDAIRPIGDDDFSSPASFRRTPRADLSLDIGKALLRLEVQAGFQGINDVKQHKWIEAKRALAESGQKTLCVHCDFFNGQLAIIPLSDIPEDDVHWITRQQMEGQTVFNIDQNQFSWGLMNQPPLLRPLDLA